MHQGIVLKTQTLVKRGALVSLAVGAGLSECVSECVCEPEHHNRSEKQEARHPNTVMDSAEQLDLDLIL